VARGEDATLPLEVLADADAVARRGAALVAAAARAAAAARGRFTLALSGGRTPWRLLDVLAAESLDWGRVHVFQVDERVAPDGHEDRNWTHVRAHLLARAPIPPEQAHPMPVGDPALAAATGRYARALEAACGVPPVLDLVQLGLGADGHTASLVPGDAVLDEAASDVAVTAPYPGPQGRRRMTLTFPALARARSVLWVVTGADKREALARLLAGDAGIPAGRVRRDRARVVADLSAAGDRGR
jgi:6-phosphogluconolactonase